MQNLVQQLAAPLALSTQFQRSANSLSQLFVMLFQHMLTVMLFQRTLKWDTDTKADSMH